jgi:hypothetical protein
MDVFEPIGEPLVINGITNENSEIQLYLFVDKMYFIAVVMIMILSLCYK